MNLSWHVNGIANSGTVNLWLVAEDYYTGNDINQLFATESQGKIDWVYNGVVKTIEDNEDCFFVNGQINNFAIQLNWLCIIKNGDMGLNQKPILLRADLNTSKASYSKLTTTEYNADAFKLTTWQTLMAGSNYIDKPLRLVSLVPADSAWTKMMQFKHNGTGLESNNFGLYQDSWGDSNTTYWLFAKNWEKLSQPSLTLKGSQSMLSYWFNYSDTREAYELDAWESYKDTKKLPLAPVVYEGNVKLSNNTRKKGLLSGQFGKTTKTLNETYKEFTETSYWSSGAYNDSGKLYTQGLLDPGVDFEPEYSGSMVPGYNEELCTWSSTSYRRPWTDKGLIYPEHLYVDCELPNSQGNLSHQMITGVPLVVVPNKVQKLTANFNINNDTGDLAYLVMSKTPIESGSIEELFSDSKAQNFYNITSTGNNIETFMPANIAALELTQGSKSYSVEIDNPDSGILYYKVLWSKDNERAVQMGSKPVVTVSYIK